MKQEIIISINDANQRLDKFLRKLFKNNELSIIFKDIRKGNIRVNGKKQKIDYKLQEGDILRIFGYHYDFNLSKKILESSPDIYGEYMKPNICYEDENVLIALKDVNTIVHSNGKEDVQDLTQNVRTYLIKKKDSNLRNSLIFTPSPINRLDRNTYGLVIFGKNNRSLNELNILMQNRKIFKYYRTLVEGKIKEGIYTAYIKKDTETNKSIVSFNQDKCSKKIQMEVKILDTNGAISLLDINLLTGRSHQIRSHLKFLGNPIIGDLKYGNKDLKNYFYNKYGIENQLLFAYKLVFNGITENMCINYLNNKVIIAPLPSYFKRIVKQEFKITV